MASSILVVMAAPPDSGRSHASSWKRRPTWSKLRLGPGQKEELLVVGDPWTFDVPARGKNKKPSTHHVVNVVLRRHLTDAAVKTCMIWEISDRLFDQIVFDPTQTWLCLERHGTGKKNTFYKIDAGAAANDSEIKLAAEKLTYDLEMVAIETRARHLRP
jgi:hypothetical protein